MARYRLLGLALVLALVLVVIPGAYSAGSLRADCAADDPVEPQEDPVSVLMEPLVPSAVESRVSNWETECVDCPKRFRWMSNRSLQLDGADRPHIAYGADHLYYAWYDGTEWHHETADQSSGVGLGASLALDDVGQPHIAYKSHDGGPVKYAWHDGQDWEIEMVDSAAYAGDSISLALDSAGRPHIGYSVWYSDTFVPKYAWWDGANWHSEMLDGKLYSVDSISLALDSASRPHIGYHDNAGMKYAWYDGTGWHTEVVTVASSDLVGQYLSLALDGLGRPHVSYSDLTNDDLKYAWRDGETWHTETVDSTGGIGTSLALDGAGWPHIGYSSGYPDNHPMYAWHDGTTWHIETVGGAPVNVSVSLALDGAGQPHVSYYDLDGDNLRYARHDGTAWRAETVDESERIGPNTSLVLNGSDQPHISFFGRGLKYAWRDMTAWHIETVNRGGGREISLALDDMGRPHIGYCSRGLKYAWHDGTSWHTEVVVAEDWSSLACGGISMALDGTGQPHIISHHGVCQSIPPKCSYVVMYSWRDGTQWHSEIVEAGSSISVGGSVSLDLDDADHPHICYDGQSGIMYAWHNGMDWEIERVDYGDVPSLALDEAGEPHISYLFYHYPDSELKYARRDGAVWHTETVDVTIDGYNCATLALDESGQPHIGYRVWDSNAQEYTWRDETGWRTEVLEYSHGGCPSLALDSAGRPHVAYQVGSPEYDLKYTWRVPLMLGKQAAPTSDVRNNDLLTYTLTMSGPGLSVRLWDPLPPMVRYVPGSIAGTLVPTAVYSPTAHAVIWEGTLPTDTAKTIRFQVTPGITGTGSLDLSGPIVNTAWLTATESGREVWASVIVNGHYMYVPLVLRGSSA